MSSRTPWHPHKFMPGNLTPNSCVICGGKIDTPQHKGRFYPKKGMKQVLKRPVWKIYGMAR